MAAFLARRWFLLLLASGLALAVLRPDLVRPVNDRLPLRLVVAGSLFLVSWSLEGRRLWLALGRPVAVVWALAISFGCLPALALAGGALLPLPDLQLGVFLIACVPCTLSSAILWVRFAGGDDALALLITVSTNALAWLVTPLWLTRAGPVPVALDAAAMMRSLVVILVLPVLAGQLIRRVPGVSAAVARHRVLNSVASRLLIALVLVCATSDGAGEVSRLSPPLLAATLAVCLAVHLAGVFLGLVAGRLPGLPLPERIAIAFAGSQKTLPVALFLFGAYYRADYPLAVLPLLFYHAGQLLADTLVADVLVRRPRAMPGEASGLD